MGIGRRSPIVVVLVITALASALDGCLMDCHPQPQRSETEAAAHCHPPALSSTEGPALSSVEGPALGSEGATPERAGITWQADQTCHHDHTAAAAERTVRIRLDSKPLAVVASLQSLSVRPLVSISPVATRFTPDRSGATAAPAPLRV